MKSHYCTELDLSHIDKTVQLCGWVHRRRDHGGVIFLDLRDRSGIVQVVIRPSSEAAFAIAERVRSEYVLQISGTVCNRLEGTVNPEMETGEIEVISDEITVLNEALTPPFQLDDYTPVGEEIRLKYRFMDLRRPEVTAKFVLRAKITSVVRRYLESHGFMDIETPILTRATPEGARDFLVPSRNHAGQFYALPQSPQLFKQLLMVSGMDRYYQIAKCFRDEDLRADRQPEFTQIDIEASFVDQQTVMDIAEGLIAQLFTEVLGVELGVIPHMTFKEAMHRFGSDKPDLRIGLEFTELTDIMADVPFQVFAKPAQDPKGRVVALLVPGGASSLTRKEIDRYTQFVSNYGAKGLAYIKVNDPELGREGLQSPIVKNLPDEVLTVILDRTAAKAGDLLFFGADSAKVVNDAIGALRLKVGQDLELVEAGWRPLWVVDFPMFEEVDGGLHALHHPFTAPCGSVEEVQAAPEKALSKGYDLVLNGYELGGGSVRISDNAMQRAVLELLGIDEAEATDKFGFLLEALQYGCPPHAGLAFGLDRIVMLMSGSDSIREVIPFPKTQTASCLLTAAPSTVGSHQLSDLGLRLKSKAVQSTV